MILICAFAGLAWGGLFGSIFMFDTSQNDIWFPGRIIAYVLLLIAPTLTFVPLSRALGTKWLAWIAAPGLAFFGYILAYMAPAPGQKWQDNLTPFICFLIGLFITVFCLFWPVLYLLGQKIFTNRKARYEIGRSIREALLVAAYIDAIFIMGAFHILGAFYALALLALLVTAELFSLNRYLRTS